MKFKVGFTIIVAELKIFIFGLEITQNKSLHNSIRDTYRKFCNVCDEFVGKKRNLFCKNGHFLLEREKLLEKHVDSHVNIYCLGRVLSTWKIEMMSAVWINKFLLRE